MASHTNRPNSLFAQYRNCNLRRDFSTKNIHSKLVEIKVNCPKFHFFLTYSLSTFRDVTECGVFTRLNDEISRIENENVTL